MIVIMVVRGDDDYPVMVMMMMMMMMLSQMVVTVMFMRAAMMTMSVMMVVPGAERRVTCRKFVFTSELLALRSMTGVCRSLPSTALLVCCRSSARPHLHPNTGT